MRRTKCLFLTYFLLFIMFFFFRLSFAFETIAEQPSHSCGHASWKYCDECNDNAVSDCPIFPQNKVNWRHLHATWWMNEWLFLTHRTKSIKSHWINRSEDDRLACSLEREIHKGHFRHLLVGHSHSISLLFFSSSANGEMRKLLIA